MNQFAAINTFGMNTYDPMQENDNDPRYDVVEDANQCEGIEYLHEEISKKLLGNDVIKVSDIEDSSFFSISPKEGCSFEREISIHITSNAIEIILDGSSEKMFFYHNEKALLFKICPESVTAIFIAYTTFY